MIILKKDKVVDVINYFSAGKLGVKDTSAMLPVSNRKRSPEEFSVIFEGITFFQHFYSPAVLNKTKFNLSVGKE